MRQLGVLFLGCGTLLVAAIPPAASDAIPLVSVGSVGAWGLAAQQIQTLDAARERARVRRLLLRTAKAATVTIGTVAAVAGFYGVLLLFLGPSWTL